MKQLRRDGPLYIFAIAANATDVLIAAMAIVHRLMGVTRHIQECRGSGVALLGPCHA